MLKNISILGKSLSKKDQKNIQGGAGRNFCSSGSFCETNFDCENCSNALSNEVLIYSCFNNSCVVTDF